MSYSGKGWLRRQLLDFESMLICNVLEEYEGNMTLAAEALEISRVSLHRRCALLRINQAAYRPPKRPRAETYGRGGRLS